MMQKMYLILISLKKVVALFRKLPKGLYCIARSIELFNKNENLLTRMFTLEYSYWFDYMLPGLQSLDVPIPWEVHLIILN